MIERITAMVADLTENGINGAAGLTLIVAVAIGVLVFSILGAMLRNAKKE